MTKFTAAFASTAAALLLAGNAFAQAPVAGEGPFFEHQVYPDTARVQTHVARQPVSIDQVAAGQMNEVRPAAEVQQPTRAEVRQQTREAIARGQGPATGMGG